MSTNDVMTSEAAKRYASALLDLADDAKSLKNIEKDANLLQKTLRNTPALSDALDNPVFAIEDKVGTLAALGRKLKLSKLMIQFVGTVAENRRASELDDILSVFTNLLARRRGTEIALVTSAKALSAAQVKSLKAQLKKNLGRTVNIETRVDPDIIGGFVVKIGSRLYDSSLRTKLSDLKLALKET